MSSRKGGGEGGGVKNGRKKAQWNVNKASRGDCNGLGTKGKESMEDYWGFGGGCGEWTHICIGVNLYP